jgi:hypothetical protein
MPDNPFAFPAIAEPAAEVEAARVEAPEEDAPATAVSASADIVDVSPVQPVVPSSLPQAVDPVPASAEDVAASEVLSPPCPADSAPEALTAPVETPKFDPLAFIRAAAVENLTTS